FRNLNGNNVLGGNITAAAGAIIQSEAGRLTINNSLSGLGDVTFQGAGDVALLNGATVAGNLFKAGAGTLLFGNNNATFPISTAYWSGGGVGFIGTQSFGAYTIPAARALRFDSDP